MTENYYITDKKSADHVSMQSVDKIAADVAATKGAEHRDMEEEDSIEKQDFSVMHDEDDKDTAL